MACFSRPEILKEMVGSQEIDTELGKFPCSYLLPHHMILVPNTRDRQSCDQQEQEFLLSPSTTHSLFLHMKWNF